MCGIEVTTEQVGGENHITSIVGDKKNPFSQGHVCPKAKALKDLYDDKDRVRHPLKKVGDSWQQITWDEALDTVAQNIFTIQQQHGNNAFGTYLGNPNAHNYGSILFGPYFFRTLQSFNRFSATSVDQLPHHIVSLKLFGHQNQIPITDIDNTDYFMIIGGNPLASNGSIMTVPYVKKRLKAIQQRGGKVVVIDPKKTETADVSSEHHFITPGSDALFILAMLNSLFSQNLVKADAILPLAKDLLEVEQYVQSYPPERVADLVGIRAEHIHKMVKEFCEAESASCYGRMGASVQRFGTLTQYLIMLFNMLSGNLDKKGGMMFTQPAADYLPHSSPGNVAKGKTRVRGLPSFSGEYPVSALAEEILTEGEGQIKGMILGAGNPVLTTPNGKQLDDAFEQLDFLVAVDFYITESSRHADIILPPVTALERDHYDIVFHKFAVRNSAKFSPAIFPMSDDKRTDWQIYLSLAEKLELKRAKNAATQSDNTQSIEAAIKQKYQPLWQKQPSGVVDDLLKSGRYANGEVNLSLQRLIDNPHGIDLGELTPNLPEALFTPSKTIELHFNYFMPDIARVESFFFGSPADDKLLLIGRRHLKSNNSWLHNSKRMVKDTARCTAQLHPVDASKYKVEDGQDVLLSSRVGEIRIACEVTEKVMPGVVCVPHGWGHDKDGVQLEHAKSVAGVSCNDITDEMVVDELSGNAVLNGVPVTISAA
jgi:anaerobic selenocysteine-containing dehydrogenase